MAEKDTGRAKKAAKPANTNTSSEMAPSVPAHSVAGQRKGAPALNAVKILEAERDALKAELEVAKARIEALEAANSHVVNRLAWTIDSLQALKDGVKT